MTFGALLVLAVGLALDATAVAAARGLSVPVVRARHVVLVAGLFGGFQGLMPAIGGLIGLRIGPLIEAWDHWLAFALLGGIGAKMLWDARSHEEEAPAAGDPFALPTMVLLAVATSIDALAVGVTLPLMGAPLALSAVTIGVVTAALSAAGLFLGRRFGAALGPRLDVVGGLVLIAIGTKILIEHLRAG